MQRGRHIGGVRLAMYASHYIHTVSISQLSMSDIYLTLPRHTAHSKSTQLNGPGKVGLQEVALDT